MRHARALLAALLGPLPLVAQAPPSAPAPKAAAGAPAGDDALRRDLQSAKTSLQRQQQENDRLRIQLEEHKTRLETLESKVNALAGEKEKKEKPKKGLLSVHNEWLELGGVLQVEFVDTENETQSVADATDNPPGHFQMEKFSLIPKVTVNEDIWLRAELDFHPRNGNQANPDRDPEGHAYLNEAYVVFQNFPGNTWVKVGMDERFIAPERLTETHPLAGTAFWRDDTIGITVGGEPVEYIYWRASVTNGLALRTRAVGEDKSFEMLHDDRAETDLSNTKEFGFGLGGKFRHETLGAFDAMAFVFGDRISRADVAVLQALPGYGASDDPNRVRAGVNFDYSIYDFDLFVQFIGARDGKLDRTAWYAQPSYKFKFEGLRWLQSVTVLYRYNQYEADITPAAANSLTWDRIAHTPALLVEIVPFVTLKLEYTFNFEDNELTQDVGNDEFLAQLEVIF